MNNEYKVQKMQWAQNIVDQINNDPREFVKYRESRPVTDIKQMLESSVELYADKVAFMQKDSNSQPYRNITYKEALEDVNGLGTSLIAKGLKGKKIAVIGENCYQWATSYLAAVCGTGVVVPLDKELNEAELKGLITRADVACVIFAKKYEEMFKRMKASGDTCLEVLVNFNAEEDTEEVYAWKSLKEAALSEVPITFRGKRVF